MMKHIYNRGFTLIELLVVIAIIGILASVVLASLNSARDKGEDAAVKSNLNNIRAQAEIYYDDNNRDYGGLCTTDANVQRAVAEAGIRNSNCADTTGANTAWGAEGELSDGNWYCVDSSGNADEFGASTIDQATNDVTCD